MFKIRVVNVLLSAEQNYGFSATTELNLGAADA